VFKTRLKSGEVSLALCVLSPAMQNHTREWIFFAFFCLAGVFATAAVSDTDGMIQCKVRIPQQGERLVDHSQRLGWCAR
jgi:hypothetical protein